MDMKHKQRGSITLETSIVLPLFMFLFLFIYGLFFVVSAHNQITHALIQSTKSLSLDSYLNEKVESAAEESTKFWGGISDAVIDIIRLDNNEYFSSQTDWYISDTGNPFIAKQRFIGYFAGGDPAAADEKLKALGIKNGLNGLTFKTKVENEFVSVSVEYEIQYWFDFMNMGKIPMNQTVKSRLWM